VEGKDWTTEIGNGQGPITKGGKRNGPYAQKLNNNRGVWDEENNRGIARVGTARKRTVGQPDPTVAHGDGYNRQGETRLRISGRLGEMVRRVQLKRTTQKKMLFRRGSLFGSVEKENHSPRSARQGGGQLRLA